MVGLCGRPSLRITHIWCQLYLWQVTLGSGNQMVPWKLLIAKRISSSFLKENMLQLRNLRTTFCSVKQLMRYATRCPVQTCMTELECAGSTEILIFLFNSRLRKYILKFCNLWPRMYSHVFTDITVLYACNFGAPWKLSHYWQ